MAYSNSDFLDDVMRCLVHVKAITEAEIPNGDPGKASDVATAAIVAMHRAALSSRFVLELLDAVDTLDGVAETHGLAAFTFVLRLQAAILNGSGVDGHAAVDDGIVALVARLPSATEWMTHIQT